MQKLLRETQLEKILLKSHLRINMGIINGQNQILIIIEAV